MARVPPLGWDKTRKISDLIDAVSNRITVVEDKYVRVLWFEQINSGTTGTVTPPAGATIVLDQWAAGIDAVTSTITSGQRPDFISAKTAAGVIITTTMDASGNWTISGAPSAYPIAILYVYQVTLLNFDRTYTLVEEEVTQATGPTSTPTFSSVTLTSGAGAGKALVSDANGLGTWGIAGTAYYAQSAGQSGTSTYALSAGNAGTASLASSASTAGIAGTASYATTASIAGTLGTNGALGTPSSGTLDNCTTDSAADNDSTTQLATTAFAKSEDAVLHREPDQAVNLTAGAIAAMSVPHDTRFTNTTNSCGGAYHRALPSWTPAVNQIIYQKLAGGAGEQVEIVATTGAIKLTLNATVYTSAIPGGGAASSLLAGSKHRISWYASVGATQTTVTFYVDGVLLSSPAAQNNVDLTNTATAYIMGTSAAMYAGKDYGTYAYNRAYTAAEERLEYLEGVNFADMGGSQTAVASDTDWTGATGATPPTGWNVQNAGTFTIVSDALEIKRDAVNSPYISKSAVTTIVGKRYRFSFAFKNVDATQVGIGLGTSVGGVEYSNWSNTTTSWVTVDYEFTATTTTTHYYLIASTSTGTQSGLFDTVSLTKTGATLALESDSIMPDRWIDRANGNHAVYPVSGSSLTRHWQMNDLQAAANNAAAAGLTVPVPVGGLYRTNADPSVICVRTA